MIAWAGVCVFCRRAIQRPADAGWWEDPDGNIRCRTSPGDHEPEAPVDRDGTSHFATCPQADQHRRRR